MADQERVVIQYPDPDPDDEGCPDCGEPLDVYGRCPYEEDDDAG